MRNVLRFIIVILMATGCSDHVEDPRCDLFLSSATATGVVLDFDSLSVADALVEFTISDTTSCSTNFPHVLARGRTDVDGRYEVLVQAGNIIGTRCIFGRVAGSDSISSGRVRFTSDCRRSEPIYNVELNLIVTPSAMIPEDLVITLYRHPGIGISPVYRCSVDAKGDVEYEGILYVVVEGFVDTTVELKSVARLFRSFEKIGYWYIKNIYDPINDCDRYIWDRPFVSTSLTANGQTKKVYHDHGCIGLAVLDSLTHLECEIDSVLNTILWTGDWPSPCN